MAATIDVVAPADAIASLHSMATWSHGIDDAYALMTENHVNCFLPVGQSLPGDEVLAFMLKDGNITDIV